MNDNWETIKAAERAAKGSRSLLDGVPMGQPALSLAAQLVRRAERAGVPPGLASETIGQGIARELFDLVRRAQEAGLDAEAELRAAARSYRDRVHAWESRQS